MIQSLRLATFASLLATIPLACWPLRGTRTSSESIVVNGVARTYRIHVPGSYRAGTPAPLVLLLHGHGASGAQIERSTGMSAKSDKEGFIAVYPDGHGSPRSWQVLDGPIGRSQDAVFIEQLIGALQKLYTIDKRRIYVAGHSNGGMMAYRLGVDLDTLVAGIGVSAALLPRQYAADAKPVPVTLVAVHGKSDNVVLYDGRSDERTGQYLSVPASVQTWAKRNGCDSTPNDVALAGGKVVHRNFSGCAGGSAVTLIAIADLTHRWPGDAKGSTEDEGVSATDEMWAVFQAHPKQ